MLQPFLFKAITTTRSNFTKLIEGLSIDQLNEIPAGLSNNIIWNYGHIVSAAESLCYLLSGNETSIPEDLRKKYAKGTKPEAYIDQVEVDLLKKLSVELLQKLEKDYYGGLFKGYKTYPTSFGLELTAIEDAISFLPVHEGLHYGYAMAQRKMILNK